VAACQLWLDREGEELAGGYLKSRTKRKWGILCDLTFVGASES
jgi:hypothetical protein